MIDGVVISVGVSAEYQPLAEITSPGKLAYAGRWGFKFHPVRFPSPNYEREYIVRIFDTFPEIQWLWWTDADLKITNHTINVHDLCDDETDLVVARDWEGFNNGSVLYRNAAGAKTLLKRLVVERDNDPLPGLALANKLWPDSYKGYNTNSNQFALLAIMADMVEKGELRVKWVPQRSINSYHWENRHDQALRDRDDPGKWQKGDLALHVPALPLDRRMEILSAAEVIA